MENTEKKEKKKFQFKMPHTYVILISIMVLMLVLTHIIPAGEYDRVEDPVSGKMVVVADSYHEIDVEAPGIFDLFLALQEGYVDAADIMFLIIFAYGFVYVLTKNGTMDAALGTMVRKIGSRVSLLIPITMLVLGILGSTMGIYEEVYGLFPVFVGIFMALAMTPSWAAPSSSWASPSAMPPGTTNPYNIAVAQDVAGVELYSGMEFRWVIFIAFEALAIFYVMRYAHRVKADPSRSLLKGIAVDSVEMKGINSLDEVKMTTRQKLCLLEFFGVIGFLTYSVLELGWYVNEIAALFLMAMVIAGIISGYSATEICKTFIESTKSMVSSMLIVGFTRGILILMKQGCITDTIVYGLVTVLDGASKYVAAYGDAVPPEHHQVLHQRLHQPGHHHYAHHGAHRGAGRTEQADRGAGLSVRQRLCRLLLAHLLRAVLRPDGRRAAEQVVPLRHPAVPDDAGPGVCIHDHRRLDRLLKDAFAPVPG